MDLIVNWDDGTIINKGKVYDINSKESFNIISDAYLKIGWQNKQAYSYTWMGRPIIQIPEDMVRMQELIYKVKPDYIVETGIAHGGSLIYYASILKAMGGGLVIGVDIDIRKHNREAIENHELFEHIKLYEGDSTDDNIVAHIKHTIKSNPKKDKVVMVVLDACHTKEHTLKELNAYSEVVTRGSYIVACDGGIMERVSSLPGAIKAEPDWDVNNPKAAAEEFVKHNDEFEIERVRFDFNEGTVDTWNSYWQGGIIKRKM